MGEKSCCCCLSVKTGAYIIGAMLVLDLLGQLENFNFLQCIIKLATVAVFGNMILSDSESSRKWFFFAWIISPFLQMMAAAIDMPVEDEEFERAATTFDINKAAQ